jgi:hypothetical protein
LASATNRRRFPPRVQPISFPHRKTKPKKKILLGCVQWLPAQRDWGSNVVNQELLKIYLKENDKNVIGDVVPLAPVNKNN